MWWIDSVSFLSYISQKLMHILFESNFIYYFHWIWNALIRFHHLCNCSIQTVGITGAVKLRSNSSKWIQTVHIPLSIVIGGLIHHHLAIAKRRFHFASFVLNGENFWLTLCRVWLPATLNHQKMLQTMVNHLINGFSVFWWKWLWVEMWHETADTKQNIKISKYGQLAIWSNHVRFVCFNKLVN